MIVIVKRVLLIIIIIAVSLACFSSIQAGAAPLYLLNQSKTSVDVSWPNCNINRKQFDKTNSFGIIGINGGLDFTVNKCLVQESSWFHSYALYLNTGYPGKTYGLKHQFYPQYCLSNNLQCLAFNYGYDAALYSINYAARNNVHALEWWLDVENVNSWTTNPKLNDSSLMGMAAAIQRHTLPFSIGYYAYPEQWNSLTNYWHNKAPAWVASGSNKKHLADIICKQQKYFSFTGGKILLAQYTKYVDHDIIC